MKLNWVFVFLVYSLALVLVDASSQDPYSLLGVSRSSSSAEIKRAYKKLAMQWHPDKNESPDASERFMQISRAYEVLSDPERKRNFDLYGTMDEQHQQQPSPFHHYGGHFDEFFFPFGGAGGQRGRPSEFEKHRLTLRMYLNSVLERSYTQPYLIFAYSSYCPSCFALEQHWTEAVNDIESLGYGIGTVNYMFDGNLFEKLRINRVPSLMVLIEGRVVHYRDSYHQLSARSIRLFARDAIPSTFMLRLNAYNALKRFLDQWETTNKPSLIFLGASKEPRLRYLLAAMKYSHFIRFAYVHLNDPSADVGQMRSALGIHCTNCENVIVFRDNPKEGTSDRLSTTSHQIANDQLTQFVERNKFLILPRISSMQYFDDLCPVSSRSQRHYCLLLPVTGTKVDKDYVNAIHRFAKEHKDLLTRSRIRISYIDVSAQKQFMGQFSRHLSWEEGVKRDILVLWRHEYVKARYAWIPSIWSAEKEIQHKTFENLLSHIQRIARGEFRLEETVQIPTLTDEYEPSFFTKISRQIVRMTMMLWFHATKEEVLPVISVVGTLLFILFIGYFLNHFLREDHKIPRFEPDKPPPYSEQWHPEDPKTPASNGSAKRSASGSALTHRKRVWREMEPMIHELRAETYFGLIRLLKPGCRSIIIIVDKESKDALLPQFARYIFPYRKNKTFSFGFLMVDKNLAWFRSLLEHTLPVDKENPTSIGATFAARSINPKQTLGTVLVLCGYKLYFSMYHPTMRTRTRNSDDSEISDDEVKQPKGHKINLENVLDGFENFLDRLIEGSIRRYYVPEWPDNLK